MLVITNSPEVTGYLKIEDLDYGEIFTFLDDNGVYMKIDNNDCFVDLSNGYTHESYEHEDRPIKRLHGELIIKE